MVINKTLGGRTPPLNPPLISGDLIRLYTSYRIFVKLRLFNKIINTQVYIFIYTNKNNNRCFIYNHDRLRIPYMYTKSIYTHVSMKYLTNYNFVLIILKLLTINIKDRHLAEIMIVYFSWFINFKHSVVEFLQCVVTVK
jgi:hypothetical protein